MTIDLRELIILISLEDAMPTISMFYGIIIRMYYAPGEHNPPHFHAYYNDYAATIALDTLETL